MSSTSATVPAWEQKLRDDMALSVPSFNTISMHSPDALETSKIEVPMHHDDYPPEDNVKNQLIAINVATVQHIQTASGACIDTIQRLRGTEPNKDVWGPAIESAYWTANQSFSKRFSNAADEAVEFISGLSPAQQSGAANFRATAWALSTKLSKGHYLRFRVRSLGAPLRNIWRGTGVSLRKWMMMSRLGAALL